MSLLGFIHHVKILGLNNVMCIFKKSKIQVGEKYVIIHIILFKN